MTTTRSAKRLNSSEMFEYAFKIAAKVAEYSAETISSVSLEGDDSCYAVKFSGYIIVKEKDHLIAQQKKNISQKVEYFDPSSKEIMTKEVFIVYPTADKDQITLDCAGAVPLNKSLDLVKQEQKRSENKEQIFIIPLCEARPYERNRFISWAASWLQWLSGGCFSLPTVRQHWTLLVIKGDQCHFYDPKGSSSAWSYSVDPVKEALELKGFSFSENYVGLQNWNDGTHCGYFVGNIMKRESIHFVYGHETLPIEKTVDDSFREYRELKEQRNRSYIKFIAKHDFRSTQANLFSTFLSPSELKLFSPVAKNQPERSQWYEGLNTKPPLPSCLFKKERNPTCKVTFGIATEIKPESELEIDEQRLGSSSPTAGCDPTII